jgi:hypothetical protein
MKEISKIHKKIFRIIRKRVPIISIMKEIKKNKMEPKEYR